MNEVQYEAGPPREVFDVMSIVQRMRQTDHAGRSEIWPELDRAVRDLEVRVKEFQDDTA